MDKLKIKTEHLKNCDKIEQTIESFNCPDIDEYTKNQKLRVHYILTKLQNEILLNGTLTGKIDLECCRCLKVYPNSINIKLNQIFPDTCEEIDLGNELRQVLILNMPNKPLCKQDCAGLCPKCGKNLNESPCQCSFEYSDPRWDKLKDIIK